MEVLIRKNGQHVEMGIAIPSFDWRKAETSDKYWFTFPPQQASKLGTLLLTLGESKRFPTYIIFPNGAAEET